MVCHTSITVNLYKDIMMFLNSNAFSDTQYLIELIDCDYLSVEQRNYIEVMISKVKMPEYLNGDASNPPDLKLEFFDDIDNNVLTTLNTIKNEALKNIPFSFKVKYIRFDEEGKLRHVFRTITFKECNIYGIGFSDLNSDFDNTSITHSLVRVGISCSPDYDIDW